MNDSLTRLLQLVRRRQLPNIPLHLQQARKKWAQRAARSMDMISIVSPRPGILLAGCHPRKLVRYFQPALRHLELTIFYRAGWTLEHEPTFTDRISSIQAAQRKFPQHRYIFAVNTPHEVELVAGTGIRAEYLNENAFIDEFSFAPDATVPVEFDAILDAQIAPYKRLELAAEVRSLLVVTYLMQERYNADYAEMIRRTLAHAQWANGPFWEASYQKLTREQVSATYRRARVGLCLSATEAANLASMQYLLSGLAIVSTESQGGRDIFFEPDYTRVVKSDSKLVAAAVDDLVRHAPSPPEIRARTLAKVWQFRDAFANIITRERGHPPVDRAWWKEFNTHRRISYQNLRKVAQTVADANER